MNQSNPAEWSVQEARRLDGPYLSRAGRLLLTKASADSYVSRGSEKVVFDYADGLVIAFFKRMIQEPQLAVSELKSHYYSSKLGHLLMPDAIPDARLATSQPPAIVFDKIEGREDDITLEERHGFRLRLEAMGITHACDLADGNLVRRPDGSLAYVDIVNGSMLVGNPKLDAYIRTLDPQIADRARRLQLRLLEHVSD